jgi:hypothetical protein
MSLFDLYDGKNKKGKETKPGPNLGQKYWLVGGLRIWEDSDQYERIDNLFGSTKKALEKANKDISTIDKILELLDSDDPEDKEEIEELISKSDLDLEKPEGRTLPGTYKTKLEDIRDNIGKDFAPQYDLYKALSDEQDPRTVGELLKSGSTTDVYGEDGYGSAEKQKIKGTPTPPITPVDERTRTIPETPTTPASAPDTSPVIQRGGGSSGTATVGGDQGGAAIVGDEMAKGEDAFAGWAGFLGQGIEGEGAVGEIPSEEAEQETGFGSGSGLMEQRAADRSEIQTLLAEQFGGSAFFFEANQDGLRIGLTADGAPVEVDDPEAVSAISITEYIVNNGITDQSRVLTLLQKTDWWQDTDNAMRAFDVTWAQLSEPGKTEYLEPIMDVLDQEAQFLGFDLSDERKFILAKDISRMGESQDSDYIRTKLLDELEFDSMSNDISGFGAARDSLQQLAYKYYTPLDDESANEWAEDIYTGERTELEYEQFLKATAVSRFPTLDKVINEMGVSPAQYFAPYKNQIEGMLGRQVNMLEEFSDVIEYMPDTGSTTSRPMTLSEVRKFVRGLPEWQQTDDAKNQAKSLSYAIGKTFGEVA